MSITIEVGFNYLPTCTDWTFFFWFASVDNKFSVKLGQYQPVLSLALENKTVTPLSLELATFDSLV